MEVFPHWRTQEKTRKNRILDLSQGQLHAHDLSLRSRNSTKRSSRDKIRDRAGDPEYLEKVVIGARGDILGRERLAA